jgi:hypothetical protein
MQHFLMIFLSLLCISLYAHAEMTDSSPKKSHLSSVSDDDDCCDDDDGTGEVDEDIIIMDEEDNDDEGVNN